MPRRIAFFLVLLLAFVHAPLTAYSDEFDKVQIATIKVTDHIYMLQGEGGNIGVCAGDDGVFMIDDQFAPLTEKIQAAIAKISDREIRFLINTHYHFDHVGGNENIGKTGSVIVAHENVRNRMNTEQFIKFFNKKIPAYPPAALPVITFTEDLKFHLNNEETHVFHVQNAHTDGDAIIYFKNANVIHTGDIYFAGIYPFIDTSAHGSVDGMIRAANTILTLINDDTKVIPGHGPLSNKAELVKYVGMLTTLRERVNNYIAAGKTLAEIEKIGPSKEFDPEWGDGFLSPADFIRILYEDLSRPHH